MPRLRTFRTDDLQLHAAIANTMHVLVLHLLKLYPLSADLQFSERCLREFHRDLRATITRRDNGATAPEAGADA